MGEAAAQARVAVDEVAHLVVVAGDDDREVVAVLLHELHERRDGLVAEVDEAALGERVRLVDEQHATERPTDDLLHLERRLADVARDEVDPAGLDELALADEPQRPCTAGRRAGRRSSCRYQGSR